jgi:hypothetical protein
MHLFTVISLLTASVSAQGVLQYIAPQGGPPPGCVNTKAGLYEMSVQPIGKQKRANTFPQREIVSSLRDYVNSPANEHFRGKHSK